MMGLNIKNEEVHELAAELARLTGKSMTAVVLEALKAREQQLKRGQDEETRAAELLAIGRRCASHIRQPVSATQHGQLIYDESGMPG